MRTMNQWRLEDVLHCLQILSIWSLLLGMVTAEEQSADVIPPATKEVAVLAVTFDNWLRMEYLQDKSGFLALVDKAGVKQIQETAVAMKKQLATGGSRLLYPVFDYTDKEQMANEVTENFRKMTVSEVKKDKQYLVKVPSGAAVAIIRVKDKLLVTGYQP